MSNQTRLFMLVFLAFLPTVALFVHADRSLNEAAIESHEAEMEAMRQSHEAAMADLRGDAEQGMKSLQEHLIAMVDSKLAVREESVLTRQREMQRDHEAEVSRVRQP